MTPHLGASTEEAQENVGIEVAEAITDYLLNGVVRNAVNLPNLDAKTYALVKPYLNLGEKLGRLLAQLAPKRNDRLVMTYGGKANEVPSDPVTRYVLKGFLELVGGKEVNQVNVRGLAQSLGLLVEEIKSNEETDFNEWLHVAVSFWREKVLGRRNIFRHSPSGAHCAIEQPISRYRSRRCPIPVEQQGSARHGWLSGHIDGKI